MANTVKKGTTPDVIIELLAELMMEGYLKQTERKTA